jgi:RNA polymerase sigma-70 factor (ECF subfamily)
MAPDPEPDGRRPGEPDGDDARLRAAVAEHLDDLYRFALSLVRDDTRAEDLVQETVVRAFEQLDRFRGDASLRTWLHRILHNLAVDQFRRSGHELTVDEVEDRWQDDAYTVDPAVVLERAVDREELQDALLRIPDDQRTAVVLHDCEGWTVPEIAAVTGVGLEACKQRLRRGRMSLVTALAEGGERREALEGVPMRCWDARQRVSDYLDGALSRAEAGRVEAHLERCPTCPPLYAALVGVHEHLGRLRDPDRVIPAGLAERIAARLEVLGSQG